MKNLTDHRKQIRVLCSYAMYGSGDLDAKLSKAFTNLDEVDVFADSGAYTAFTQGLKINVEDYAAWLHKWRHRFTVYANLDVIGSAKGTWENQQALESMGLKPLPIYHGGDEKDYFFKYLDNYAYMALGGVAHLPPQSKGQYRFLAWCFHEGKGKAAFHGFGRTHWEMIITFPFYSVDSTSWIEPWTYGRVKLFDRHAGIWRTAGFRQLQKWQEMAHICKAYGVDWKEFVYTDEYAGNDPTLTRVTHLAYKEAEEWVRKRFGDISIPSRAGSIPAQRGKGLKIYLAASSVERMSIGAQEIVKEYFDVRD